MRLKITTIVLMSVLLTGCSIDTSYTPSDPSIEVEQSTVEKYIQESAEKETEKETEEETKVYSLGDISLSDMPIEDWETKEEPTSSVSSTEYSTEYYPNEIYTPTETSNTEYYQTSEVSTEYSKDPYEVDKFTLTKPNNSYIYTTRSSDLLEEYKDESTGVVFGEQGNNNTQPNWMVPINEDIDKYNGYIHQIVGNWYSVKYPQNDENRYNVGQPILISAVNTDISSDGYNIRGSYFLVYKDNPLVKVSVQLNTQQNGNLIVTIEE